MDDENPRPLPTLVAAPLELHVSATEEGVYVTEKLGPIASTILVPWGNLDGFVGCLMDANAARIAASEN